MSTTFKTIKRKIKYGFIYVFVKMIISISGRFPKKTWLTLFGVLGQLVFYCAPSLRKRVTSNLLLAYGREKSRDEIRSLCISVFTMFGKNAGALLRGYTARDEDDFRKHCIITGQQYAQRAYDRGKGVIFLTAHIGPFESVATALSMAGYQPFIIGSRLKDERLNDLVVRHRSKLGATVIERGKETFRVMKNILTGGTVAMLIDQDTKVKSVFVDFFGKPCATPVGATLLALKTGAAVIPVFAKLNNDGWQEITYYPEVRIERTGDELDEIVINTQKFTSIIENEIRKNPAQWVWMHNRWKTRPVHAGSVGVKDLQHQE